MTDLHTHILPGMDDGPQELASALALLDQQARQGIRRIALTSHYDCTSEPLAEFLSRREASFAALRAAAPAGLDLKRGCEVWFSPELLRIEASKLCLEGTPYLLLELPVLQKPAFLREVLTGLGAMGIVPLIAHAERYSYVRRDPELLRQWCALGARVQVNAGSLAGPDSSFVSKLIRSGFVHVLASDAHDPQYRPANLGRAMKTLPRRVGAAKVRELSDNADRVYRGEELPERASRVRSRIFGSLF